MLPDTSGAHVTDTIGLLAIGIGLLLLMAIVALVDQIKHGKGVPWAALFVGVLGFLFLGLLAFRNLG